MKKIMAYFLAFVLTVSLCACGSSTGTSRVTTPTRPESIVVPESFTEPESAETEVAKESTEGKYPWELEFHEEDYTKLNFTSPNKDKVVYWREGGMYGKDRRELYEWADTGVIVDTYYYPSGNTSHTYTWNPDGTYYETHILDNGHYDEATDTTYSGTIVYQKTVRPTGYEYEEFFDENGKSIRMNQRLTDGTFVGEEYYASGKISKSVTDTPARGEYQEAEYYENGNIKRFVSRTPDYTSEECYSEDGHRTYFYNKDAYSEVELVSDENGMLVRVTENGTVIEDEQTLAQYAANFNFRH